MELNRSREVKVRVCRATETDKMKYGLNIIYVFLGFAASIGVVLAATPAGDAPRAIGVAAAVEVEKTDAAAEIAAEKVPPEEGGSADVTHGKRLFGKHCALCHGAKGAGGLGPSLRGLKDRLTIAEATKQIKEPRGTMPAMYPNLLTEKDVRDVAVFAHSL